jgi:pimeloyl-ACP methyl ester carboxylesterase
MQVQQLIGKQIVFYGHSLGGAVATYAASLRPGFASGLVLENTFSSIPDMVDEFYPSWTPYRYMKPLLWNHWDTFSLLTAKEGPLSNMPMLFISGEHDEIVPAAMMRKIFDRCVSPEKSWLTVPRGLHNDTWHKGGALHVNALRSFVAAVQTRSSTSS